MELDGVELEEIKPFYDSLAVEKEQLRFPLEEILKSKFIKGVRVDGKLAGIGGITLPMPILGVIEWS